MQDLVLLVCGIRPKVPDYDMELDRVRDAVYGPIHDRDRLIGGASRLSGWEQTPYKVGGLDHRHERRAA